ncbi:hypothetical protein CcI49_25860 [Frankia sp. CcI49]|uniref:hypothetical protein n=1 Tax=Frankia sp. CcI49 TaxID=1745382 RepID=UPI000978A1BF|nr:hypothetical protein [Frankia sp. CcI49]ONH57859.1 hypothetical protein CcI49_25860 [Frankia sp. CcI49]
MLDPQPRPVLLAALVRVAGTRWTVEENFRAGKEFAVLDEHQVRRSCTADGNRRTLCGLGSEAGA